ncbi:MAG: hypothetical protein SCH70_14290 [Candidatus Methanoperedens sp.]|nr:hypothetical protein [Candidatus Methanoperedens sp.]
MIRKVVSLFLAMLMLMATIAVPVAVAEANTGTNTETTVGTECNTCGAQITGDNCGCSGGCGNSNITAVQLNGAEANKAIADALKNDKVKEFRNELIDRGYTPKVNHAEVAVKTMVTDSYVNDEVISVMIPFKSQSGMGNANIVIIMSNGEEDVQALIQNGQVLTIINGDGAYTSGPASILSEPMDILKSNNSYQEIATNLTAQGYIIDEENAHVVLNGSSNTAGISVKANGLNDTRFIFGMVDLESETVISVYDPTCEEICDGSCSYLASVPCGIGCAKLCKVNVICLGVCLSLCYVIHEYGCDSGCDWICNIV